MAKTWYRCLAEVPNIDYRTPQQIDRSRLPGHDVEPAIRRFRAESDRRDGADYLMWPMPDGGSTSASPASSYKATLAEDASVLAIVANMHESLALPGAVRDYHFAISACLGVLQSKRRADPNALAEVEAICLLDIAIVEQYPEIVHDSEYVTSFQLLLDFYVREGFLREALDVAERGARLRQAHAIREIDSLRDRIAEMEHELDS